MNRIPPCHHWSKIFGLVTCTLLTLTLVGCSSVKTHVDNGHVTAHTFSFLNTGSSPPSYSEERKEAHAMIQQALTRNLSTHGISHVSSGGDLTVAYLVVVGNNATTTSLNRYFGYTDDSSALVEKVHAEQTAEN